MWSLRLCVPLFPSERCRGPQVGGGLLGHEGGLGPAGEPQGGAVLGGHQGGEFLSAGRVQLGEPGDDGLAVYGGRPGPGSVVEGVPGGPHGQVDVGGGRLGGPSDQ